jgi:hypothetical protein
MKYKIHKPKTKKSFKNAVKETPDVRECFRAGKQAILAKERDKVELADLKKCGGSLFIDKCLFDQKKYLNDNRWDYALDYDGQVFFFEVHTASSGEVSTVIKKLAWLKGWLITNAPEINSLKATAPFYWVQSNGYHILPNSSFERLANQNGIIPIPKLILK